MHLFKLGDGNWFLSDVPEKCVTTLLTLSAGGGCADFTHELQCRVIARHLLGVLVITAQEGNMLYKRVVPLPIDHDKFSQE